jgi:magnesium-protoporphyrin IX monomethyl ester (oxidative) cyclase
MAQETTLLAPRFYTIDFAELDRVSVESVREDRDILIARTKADPNRKRFKKTADWDPVDFRRWSRSCARS